MKKLRILLPLFSILLTVSSVCALWEYPNGPAKTQEENIYPFLYDFYILDQEENEVINKMLREINTPNSAINSNIKAREDGLLGWNILTYSYLGSMDPYYGNEIAASFGSDYDFIVSYEVDKNDNIVGYSMYITKVDIEKNFLNGKYCEPVNRVDFIWSEVEGRYVRTDITPGKAKYAYYNYEFSWLRKVKGLDYKSWVSTE